MPVDAFTEAIGNALMRARLRQGLTQTGLADAINLHRTTVTRIETGALTPSMTTVARWAEACGVTVDDVQRAVDLLLRG